MLFYRLQALTWWGRVAIWRLKPPLTATWKVPLKTATLSVRRLFTNPSLVFDNGKIFFVFEQLFWVPSYNEKRLERRAISIQPKIPEISVRNQMKRTFSFRSDRNIWEYLWRPVQSPRSFRPKFPFPFDKIVVPGTAGSVSIPPPPPPHRLRTYIVFLPLKI